MPTYSFHCADCGSFDVRTPIAARPESMSCPTCGGTAVRRFQAPALAAMSRSTVAAFDLAAQSAENPAVVHAAPPQGVPTPSRRRPGYPPLPRP